MFKLTEQDKNKISQAVKVAERTTSGEIVPMIVRESDHYPAAYFRAAFLLVVLGTVAYYASYYFGWLQDMNINWLLTVQLAGFVLGFLLCVCPFMKRNFLSKQERSEEVHQRALQFFLNNNLHITRDRTGILIMISLLERRVEIVADSGINGKLEQKVWDEILQNLITNIKQQQITKGLCEAIAACGDVLTKHFPARKDDQNELKDDVVIA